ncbi:PREDICTED: seipin-1 [Nelumbo nucifera]|uniref:Seipin-1 n=1 Tax=Nelumbo nucifera TaxID=4432 RepID=A0A1U8A5J4_NELNU|nr:PREDICTED: seipin-1 [Nelumbo nucifera]
MDTHPIRPSRRTLLTTIPHPRAKEDDLLILKPAAWFVKLVAFQAELISNCLEYLSSTLFSFLSTSLESVHRAEEVRESAGVAVPSRVADGSGIFLRKLGFGLVGAIYAVLLLTAVMVLAIIVGVGWVQWWVEEPVFVREPLHFDYTDVHPSAVFSFSGGLQGNVKRAIPAGHTFYVSVVLLMPESDFNRQIGVFQLTAEVLSATGDVLATSSQPCMLRFRSPPVRLMRTFVMGIPLTLGISGETQKITVDVLKHMEGKPRTEAIRIRLKPRAGITSLPELYEAEILVNSKLPWRKEFVYNWKWTFYVWASLYVYIMLLVVLACWYKPFLFPTVATGVAGRDQRSWSLETEKHPQSRDRRDGEISDTLRKWQPIRSKRKSLLPHGVVSPENAAAGSSTTSFTVNPEEACEVVEDSGGFGDSESVS